MATKPLDTKRLSETLVEGAKKYIDLQLDGFNSRLKILEMAESELKFLGTYQRAIQYKRNNLLTHDGSLWICLRDRPVGKPGASDDWQLVAKRGADGKDKK